MEVLLVWVGEVGPELDEECSTAAIIELTNPGLVTEGDEADDEDVEEVEEVAVEADEIGGVIGSLEEVTAVA